MRPSSSSRRPILRDRAVATDGWEPKSQYVGFDEDFVPTADAKSHEQSVVPFYKSSFVWQMARQTTDYYLRVVVPLTFILIVAWISVFIPRAHFEAIVTIQVTALLSAVALYLALPKVEADISTLSDRIFLFIYMAVSLMIGISVLRINSTVANIKWLRTALGAVHIMAVPALGCSWPTTSTPRRSPRADRPPQTEDMVQRCTTRSA